MGEVEVQAPARIIEAWAEWSKGGTFAVYKGQMPLFKSIPIDHYIPPQMHVITGIVIKLCVLPLRYAAMKQDMIDKTGRCELKDDEEMEKAGKVLWKDILACKKRISLLKPNIVERDRELKDGELLLECLYAMRDGRIEPPRRETKECHAGPSCLSKHKAHSHLSAETSLENFVECNTCKGWYHNLCECIFVQDDIAILKDEDEEYDCRRCVNAQDNEGKKIDYIKGDLEKVRNYADECQRKLLEEEKNLNDLQHLAAGDMGPRQLALDAAFRGYGVDFRTWGQCVTGNHIQALLKHPDAATTLWSMFPNEDKVPAKIAIMKTMRTISHLSASRDLTEQEKEEMSEAVESMEKLASEAFPRKRRFPKFHTLLSHIVPTINSYNSWGFFNDQPSEAIHQWEKKKGRQYACIRKKMASDARR